MYLERRAFGRQPTSGNEVTGLDGRGGGTHGPVLVGPKGELRGSCLVGLVRREGLARPVLIHYSSGSERHNSRWPPAAKRSGRPLIISAFTVAHWSGGEC